MNGIGSTASPGGSIVLRDVTKRYIEDAPPAVDSVSLEISSGEFVTLLGPSGSGKTTTLNMIAGFVEPTSGVIELDGKDLGPVPTHRRDFGMVFQSYALFPHMTVSENVAFPLVERRMSKTEIAKAVGEALELVELEEYGNRRPKELSGGQQQRVALARALVYRPRVLLLDEPLGALDRKLRQALQGQIARIHNELKTTFIFVTHDQDEAMFLSDRIAVFNQGRLVRVGTPTEVYRDPQSLWVAKFIGEVNAFPGRCTDGAFVFGDNRWRLDTAPGDQEEAVLIVRPEAVGVATEAEAVPSHHNTVKAKVVNSAFLGSVCRVEVSYGAGLEGAAMLPGGMETPPLPGEELVVHWSPTDQTVVEG